MKSQPPRAKAPFAGGVRGKVLRWHPTTANADHASRRIALHAGGVRLLDSSMNRATPHMRDLSQAVIACEMKAQKTSSSSSPAAFYVCERLRPHLATLMGGAGFNALLARALTLAQAEVPWLRTLRVKPDGSLESSEDLQAQTAPETVAKGSVVLVAQLLGLLVTFIGEILTLRLVREAWPKLSPKDLASAKGDHK